MEQLKLIHVTCVVLSFSGFFLRGIWMLQHSPFLQNKWVKILPHIIDSVLLLSALLMLYVGQWSVLENNWLIAKISALMLYIGFGVYALKRGKTQGTRLLYWMAGMLVFLYIVSVALTKSAMVFWVF